MITKYYNCEFKSDIVLPASSNTQGNIINSDFISGSNFLGMVAANGGYESFGDDAFDVFHSGDVCFGDAHISIEDSITYKTPLSYHNEKIDTKKVHNRIHLSKDEQKELRKKQKQLKQLRSGYIDSDGNFTTIEYNYTQKSSYDKTNRRSEDSGMYGYSAIKSGTNWIFKIDYIDEKHIAQIEKNLLGDKKLGKSKSSQYGQVNIIPTDTPSNLETFTPKYNLSYLYVNSRLALHNQDGVFTAIPTIENLGLEDGEIDWEKTYIKTSTYTPYNYTRATKDYERVCINKGSVIAIKNLKGKIGNRIGAFVSEGFGDIIVNPKFLEQKEPNYKEYKSDDKQISSSNDYDKSLIDFLTQKALTEQIKFDISSDVQNVYEKLIGPSKSQWGEIRSFASISKDKEELISKIEEYISKGVAKKQWEDKKEILIKLIKEHKNPLEFTKMLAMIVSKHTKGGTDEK